MLRYRTVFISDTHLGSRGAQARDLSRFLRCLSCERLYLVGDVVDLWRMRSRVYWPVEHHEVLQHLLRLIHEGTEVIYVPGNHDEAVRGYRGARLGGVRIEDQVVHETADHRRFLVIHGDQFDMVVRHSRLVSMAGSAAYEWLIRLNRVYNAVRRWRGKPYWSLAQYVKSRVKSACTYVSRFEEALTQEARRRGLHGVICGHIHKPEQRVKDGFVYHNCGDWIESCTAVVEDFDGSLHTIEALPAIAEMVKRQRAGQMAPASWHGAGFAATMPDPRPASNDTLRRHGRAPLRPAAPLVLEVRDDVEPYRVEESGRPG